MDPNFNQNTIKGRVELHTHKVVKYNKRKKAAVITIACLQESGVALHDTSHVTVY